MFVFFSSSSFTPVSDFGDSSDSSWLVLRMTEQEAFSNFVRKVLALYRIFLEIATIISEMLHHVKCITYYSD